MSKLELDNAAPKVFEVRENLRENAETELDESAVDEFDSYEIFDLIRNVQDPEHPYSLEQLGVVSPEQIKVDNKNNVITLQFTPTIPHCSMATLIGLSLRVKLLRSLPTRFKVDIEIEPGTHSSEGPVNKQLNDKERVAAALENSNLLNVVNTSLKHSDDNL